MVTALGHVRRFRIWNATGELLAESKAKFLEASDTRAFVSVGDADVDVQLRDARAARFELCDEDGLVVHSAAASEHGYVLHPSNFLPFGTSVSFAAPVAILRPR